MGLNIGNKALKDAYIGNKPIKKIYLGDKLLWQRLPYDAEIEYLESSGTQFINSNINATTTLETKVDFALVNGFTFSNSSYIFGTYSQNPLTIYSVSVSSMTSFRVPSTNGFATVTCDLEDYGIKHILDYKFGSIKLDEGVISTNSGQVNTQVPIRLFGRGGGANQTTDKLRIYSVQFIDNNEVILDLIPVRVGQVGYMYDKVSGQLFGNAGTGDFILGNDI